MKRVMNTITDVFDAQSDVWVTPRCVNYFCSLESEISSELKRLGSVYEVVYGVHAVRGHKTPALCLQHLSHTSHQACQCTMGVSHARVVVYNRNHQIQVD